MDIKNINVSVVNHDSSSASEDLIHVIESSNYFILGKVTADYANGILTNLEKEIWMLKVQLK